MDIPLARRCLQISLFTTEPGEMDGLKVQEVWRDFPSVLSLGFTVKQLNIHQTHDEDMQLIWDGESGACTWVLGDTRGWGDRERGMKTFLKNMVHHFIFTIINVI